MEEDTDLAHPSLQHRPGASHTQKHTQGVGSKPGPASKDLDENVTTDKRKAGGGGRTQDTFPGKPSDDIIDLDAPPSRPSKKPFGGFSGGKESLHFHRHHDSDPLDGVDLRLSTPVPPTAKPGSAPITTVTELGPRTPSKSIQHGQVERTRTDSRTPGTGMAPTSDKGLVQGPDGRTFRYLRGLPGPAGPQGRRVSILFSDPSTWSMLYQGHIIMAYSHFLQVDRFNL